MDLLDRCFPPEHQLHKLLNRSTVKVSYSCMQNVGQIIKSHNQTVEQKSNPQEPPKSNCNCRKGSTCPLNGNCLEHGVIYQATVKTQDSRKDETYIGLTENSFKTRYNGHTCSFRNESKRHSTALSKYIWKLKDSNTQHEIQWKIITKARAYSTTSKSCNLCLREKYYIICRPEMASLNNRSELSSVCRHRKKCLLSSFNPCNTAPT